MSSNKQFLIVFLLALGCWGITSMFMAHSDKSETLTSQSGKSTVTQKADNNKLTGSKAGKGLKCADSKLGAKKKCQPAVCHNACDEIPEFPSLFILLMTLLITGMGVYSFHKRLKTN